jgi:hypothetical protein
LLAFGFSALADSASLDPEGAAYCKLTGDGHSCTVAWKWLRPVGAHQYVERLDLRSSRWYVIEESTADALEGAGAIPVTPGNLYRVRACREPLLENTCSVSTSFWALFRPASAADIPAMVASPRGELFAVTKSLSYDYQIEQYNLYRLAVALEGVDHDALPLMTAPAKRWGAAGSNIWDAITNGIYEDYQKFRSGSPPTAPLDPRAPKEFISDVPEAARAEFRAQRLRGGIEKSMIVFEPESPARHTITIFADFAECDHCKLLVRDLDQLLQNDVRVRFLAYPLAGPETDAGKTMENIWCSADPQSALKASVRGAVLPTARCKHPIVTYHYALARRLGVLGSPGVIAENGEQIGGYLAPHRLIETLRKFPASHR